MPMSVCERDGEMKGSVCVCVCVCVCVRVCVTERTEALMFYTFWSGPSSGV